MIGTKWAPSIIENTLYDIMEGYEIGFELYEYDAVKEIIEYFNRKPDIQWQLTCSEWPNETGGVCSVSFIDTGTLHLITFDYKGESR